MGEAGGGGGVAKNTDVIMSSRGAAFEGWAAGIGSAYQKAQFSLSPNARNPAKLPKSRQATPSLDFPGAAAMFAQPLGSPSGYMRNKITKLLIIVVPRRTAGDG